METRVRPRIWAEYPGVFRFRFQSGARSSPSHVFLGMNYGPWPPMTSIHFDYFYRWWFLDAKHAARRKHFRKFV